MSHRLWAIIDIEQNSIEVLCLLNQYVGHITNVYACTAVV